MSDISSIKMAMAVAVAATLPAARVHTLDLAHNQIGDRGGIALAQALARGGSVDTATGVVLFEHSEVRMLFSAAQAGTLRPSLEALSAHRRAVVSRRIPDFIARVQTVSVCITAVGVITVGVTFFREYSRAVL